MPAGRRTPSAASRPPTNLIVARLLGLSIPSVPATAVAALATLVATYATRPIVKKITKRDDQG
ncbi:hypothetical protein [Streptomyces decoyicus]